MKLVTILGTRPELIRLSLIIPKLDKFCEHILVHTGQNYDYNLDKIFRDELDIRQPDYYLDARGAFSVQLAQIFTGLEEVLMKEKPDAFLVLGDTNSSLGAIIAKRYGIKVFHMEAGNRCYDDRVPEEVNRRLIDHASDVLMPYTERSRQNLLAEGIPGQNIYVTGNPIKEVIQAYTDPTFDEREPYYLITMHRAENVDKPERLGAFINSFHSINHKIIWPMHPHTRKRVKGITFHNHLEIIEPVGFKEFITLERNADLVLTDSGTVQEECAIFGTPVVTLRDSTERPETIERGNNIISGSDPEDIIRCINIAMNSKATESPEEYMRTDVSDTVVKIVLGYNR